MEEKAVKNPSASTPKVLIDFDAQQRPDYATRVARDHFGGSSRFSIWTHRLMDQACASLPTTSSGGRPPRPLSVALVSTQNDWHGGEEQAALLADGLVRRGHPCRLLARAGSVFAHRMRDRGFELATFPGRGRLPHALWQIRRTLRRWQPDVVYFNDPHALTAAGLASVGLRIPLRVAARRVDFALQSIVRYQRMTDHVICVSNAVRDVCVAGGLDPRRLHVVHDGVDPERMGHGLREQGRFGLGIQSETILLLTVAKLTDHKGHRFFLEALPAIVRACPNLIWAVAGDGPLAADLHSQTRQLGLGEHVRFLGYRNDVAHLIAAANFMVVPSYMEGLCSSVVDAMLAGLPVIATRAGGIPDLLDARSPEESPVGWLVPPRNPPELAKAVLDAVRSAELVQQRVRAARLRAEREFTASEMVERTLSVFHRSLRTAPVQRQVA